MKRTQLLHFAAISFIAVYSTELARADEQPGLHAGAAISNITPELGGEIIGGFLPIVSKHVHDQLHARCLVLDDGEKKLAFVVCDLLGIHRLVSDEARRQIAERAAIPRENVLISATHTHSACSANSFMVSLAHGYYGYLPTPRQHELGGYETWLGTNRLEKQASEKMLAELLDMAGELKGK